MFNFEDIRVGDVITVQYVVDERLTREVRVVKLKVLYEVPRGWNCRSVKSGWDKVVTPTNCEILGIRHDTQRIN